MSDGTPPAPTELDGIVRWALDRVRAYLRRYGFRLTQGTGGVGDLYVGVDEVRAVLDGGGDYDLLTELGLAETSAAETRRPPGPAVTLAQRYGLDERAMALLLAAAAPHLSVDVARLYTFAWADFTTRIPTVGFLAELVADGPIEAAAAHAVFRPDGPLVGGALVRLVDGASWGEDAPPTHLGVVVPRPVLAFLRGEAPALSPTLGAAATLWPAEAPPLPSDAGPRVDRLRALLAGPPAPLLLIGQTGAGRSEALRAALADSGVPLLDVDLDRLPDDPSRFEALLVEAAREARMRGAALALRGDAGLPDLDPARSRVLAERVEAQPGVVALATSRPIGALRALLPTMRSVDFPLPPPVQQIECWRRALAGVGDDALPEQLVERFQASPGAIDRAAAEARDDAEAHGEPLTLDHLARALRRRINHALEAVAEPMSTTLTWDDVVLPEDVLETLHEIRSQARHRVKVFEEWGFRRKVPYGAGLGCLFAGPPGTGKTMMAGILAADLGRELYRVDLSRVVSKWVGETEKNLARVFDEAERGQVILFFDEADSLFSSRTEVKGANDRFANMEVNYLLQRMEDFDGVTILTTNFERGIDDAFKRRLRFRVQFPLPQAPERAELWHRMIPPEMPTADDIDFERLGRKHKLSGGNIKNAVLRAAFYAAEDGGLLTQALLTRAAEAEARELGRL